MNKEDRSDGYVILISLVLILVDGMAIWWGWNSFVHHAFNTPRVSFLDCIGLGLLKDAIVRGMA